MYSALSAPANRPISVQTSPPGHIYQPQVHKGQTVVFGQPIKKQLTSRLRSVLNHTRKEEAMVKEREEKVQIMAIDCCEHTIAALGKVTSSRLTLISLGLRGNAGTIERNRAIDLIVIGVANYPVRRIFISQIRAVFPNVPLLILRRGTGDSRETIRAEFILSDQNYGRDLEIVHAVRTVLPLEPCTHTSTEFNYDVVREVMHQIYENYSDPNLHLEEVAKAISMSSTRLSRILNQQVGISFRQLLRRTRIEEAKRMLGSKRYIIKEVAVRVGFTDSHYFSRSFKALTGQSASEFCPKDAIFG